MKDDLSKLSSAEIDALPFGYIALAPDGTVRKYNRYEADLARKDPAEVLGKNFFREVAPCTQVQDFEGRFMAFAAGEVAEPTLSFDFEFAFRHGTQKVRIGFVRSPLEKEVIVTVNRVRDLALPMSAELKFDNARGRFRDAAGGTVVAANGDFWRSLHRLYDGLPESERSAHMHRLGREWGIQHALRTENHVQRQLSLTLREVELQVALGSLSGSVATLGLGTFDVQLEYRGRGLLVVQHQHSPFSEALSEIDGHRCALLAGLHAGFLSYLSGRALCGVEISCGHRPELPCRFLVATESRLQRLLDPVEGSADADLLVHLGMRPGSSEESESTRVAPAEADHG